MGIAARRRAKVKKQRGGFSIQRKDSRKRDKKFPLSQDAQQKWQVAKTLKQNYGNLGVAYDANEVVTKAQREHIDDLEFDDISKYQTEGAIAFEDISKYQAPVQDKSALEKVPEAAEPRVAKLGIRERWVFKALYERYGEDYKAMARDIKMNPNQYTPKQLKKKIAIYLEYHKEECESKTATFV